MSTKIDDLRHQIARLEGELEAEFERRRAAFSYTVEKKRVVFEQGVQQQHAAARQKLASYLAKARPLVVLTAPFIYAVIVPFVLLDLFVTIYQAVCFPVYRIEKVRRADYITFDRSRLSYLNALEKFNCMYCSYGNGLLAYAREIAGRTEEHWCPIKHARRIAGTHPHYPEFSDFGDAEAFQKRKQEFHAKTK
jgi:hypothetical protein